MKSIRGFLNSEIFLFMVMGATSTGLMFGMYVLFNLFMHYQVSYFISYVFTVIVAYFLNTMFVFKKEVSLKTFIRFPLIYVVQYVLGAILLEILVRLGFSVTYSPLLIIMLLLPVTYILNRIVFAR